MNEFTKEELQYIWSACNELSHSEGCHPSVQEIIFLNKIQSMIDNYCEHDCKATIWQCQVTSCSKCGFPSNLSRLKIDNQ